MTIPALALLTGCGAIGQSVRLPPVTSNPTGEIQVGKFVWIDLQRMLKEHPAKWMIWEGAPDPASVEKLKSMGINSLVFDPCGNIPHQGDFLSIMKQNVDNPKVVFR